MNRLRRADFNSFDDYIKEYKIRKNIQEISLGSRMNLVGETYGLLEVKEYIGTDKCCIAHYICKCECGELIVVPHNHLRSGHTRSCGCEMRRINAEMRKSEAIHGMWQSRIYNIHSKMIVRCYNPNYHGYADYGGRGIYMCDDWIEKDENGNRKGFINFYNWAIENGYSDNLSIDRIDVNGPYSPENCRWVNDIVQANNRRNNHYIEYKGYNFPIAIWSEITGLDWQIISHRLKKNWPIEKILRTPKMNKKWDDAYLCWEVDPKYIIHHKPKEVSV